MRISFLSVLPVFLSVVASATAGTIIFQDNFSNAAPNSIQDTSALGPLFAGANFSLTAGSVDLNGNNFYSELCAGSGSAFCIDTTGAQGQRGQITSTSITLAPGTYALSFDLFGWSSYGLNETATVNVTLGSFVNQTFNVDGSKNPYTPDVINFTVANQTTAQLVFTDTGATDSATFAGAVLNNIEIQAIPEPSSFLLAGAAIAALAGARKAVK